MNSQAIPALFIKHIYSTGLPWALIIVFAILPCNAVAETFHVTRLNNAQPIIAEQHFKQLGAREEEGSNINGPSVIRIPDWIPAHKRASPKAKYYMYFAHHKGRYIRLAWAINIEGPWNLFDTGAGVVDGERGVLDMGDDRSLAIGNSLTIISHIASPDVRVDNNNKRIIMYFHGPATHEGEKFSGQRSFVAVSSWGLDFAAGIEPVVLGGSYLRVFEYDGVLHGLNFDTYSTPHNRESPWSSSRDYNYGADGLWQMHEARFMDFSGIDYENGRAFAPGKTRVRHSTLYRTGTRLHIFFTMIKHSPERILLSSVDLESECWFCNEPESVPEEVLRAEELWEGSAIAPRRSRRGAAHEMENALRDPYVFEEEGKLYLFYAGGGERAIGVAQLTLVSDKLRTSDAGK